MDEQDEAKALNYLHKLDLVRKVKDEEGNRSVLCNWCEHAYGLIHYSDEKDRAWIWTRDVWDHVREKHPEVKALVVLGI